MSIKKQYKLLNAVHQAVVHLEFHYEPQRIANVELGDLLGCLDSRVFLAARAMHAPQSAFGYVLGSRAPSALEEIGAFSTDRTFVRIGKLYASSIDTITGGHNTMLLLTAAALEEANCQIDCYLSKKQESTLSPSVP